MFFLQGTRGCPTHCAGCKHKAGAHPEPTALARTLPEPSFSPSGKECHEGEVQVKVQERLACRVQTSRMVSRLICSIGEGKEAALTLTSALGEGVPAEAKAGALCWPLGTPGAPFGQLGAGTTGLSWTCWGCPPPRRAKTQGPWRHLQVPYKLQTEQPQCGWHTRCRRIQDHVARHDSELEFIIYVGGVFKKSMGMCIVRKPCVDC